MQKLIDATTGALGRFSHHIMFNSSRVIRGLYPNHNPSFQSYQKHNPPVLVVDVPMTDQTQIPQPPVDQQAQEPQRSSRLAEEKTTEYDHRSHFEKAMDSVRESSQCVEAEKEERKHTIAAMRNEIQPVDQEAMDGPTLNEIQTLIMDIAVTS
jgi:hypothetical protein